jgi:hypothetical protein
MKTKHLLVIFVVAAAIIILVYKYVPGARPNVTTNTATSTMPTDNRKLLTVEEMSAIDGTDRYLKLAAEIRDSGGPNYDAPTTEVLYEDKEAGVSIMIPFNPAWGSKDYRLHPYEELKGEYGTTVMFGPIFEGEGGGFGRRLWLRPEQKQSLDSIVAGYTEPYGEAEIKTIDGRQVAEVVAKESCNAGYHFIVIPGQTYNWHLSGGCGGGFRNADGTYIPFDFKYLETVLAKAVVR